MDLHTSLVYVGVVVVSAAVILLVSMFGIKEKSYEEAIAEQRKLPDDHLLMGKKEKGKEKKHKNKTGKKVKEKKEEKEEKEEKTEQPTAVHFDENPVILPLEPTLTEVCKGAKKKSKIEKVKPILVNKDESSMVIPEPTEQENLVTEVNHFDRIHPKDSVELIRRHSREGANLQQSVQSEPLINKSPKETPTKTKKNVKEPAKKKEETKEEKKEIVVSSASAPQQQHQQQQQIVKEVVKEIKEVPKEAATVKGAKEIVVAPTVAKESKKGKKKNDILAQIGGDRDGINVSLLTPLVQKAELSRSEIQILIDQLLNKQQDNPSEHSEWTEGRTDPVIKLKKQLAEKDKALTEEHESSLTFQNKLKELRAEFNAERTRWTTMVKQLEEALASKVAEAQTSHTRIQHILESHAAEKQGLARQIEQMQSKFNEDVAIIQKMHEDQDQTQGHMQQELIAQRKQLEAQYGQMHDNEKALKAQLAQKHVEVQELQNVNMNMTQELQATCESSTAEIEMLRQQLGMMEEHLKGAGERMQDMARQLEDSHRVHADSDHRLKNAHRHEQELQKQILSLQAELKIAKSESNETAGLKSELNKMQSELLKIKSDLSVSQNEAAEITALRTAINDKDEQIEFHRSESTQLANLLHKEREQLKFTEHQLVLLRQQKVDSDNIMELLQKARCKITELESELDGLSTGDLSDFTPEVVAEYEDEALQNGDKNDTACAQRHIKRLQAANFKLTAKLNKLLEHQKEMSQQREESESQSAATTERPDGEGRENGVEEKLQKNNLQLTEQMNLLAQKDEQLDELKVKLMDTKSEINQNTSQIDDLKAQLGVKDHELESLRTLVENLTSEVSKQSSATERLQEDLEAQRSKNNELRTKNWKVMEALSAAESRAKSNPGKSIDASVDDAKVNEQEATKALLQRIFPEVKVSDKSFDTWLAAFESQVTDVVEGLRKSGSRDVNSELVKENKNLQEVVTNYKNIIADTEGILTKLQTYVESKESRWESQLLRKEKEIANLRLELEELQKKTSSNKTVQRTESSDFVMVPSDEGDSVEKSKAETNVPTAEATKDETEQSELRTASGSEKSKEYPDETATQKEDSQLEAEISGASSSCEETATTALTEDQIKKVKKMEGELTIMDHLHSNGACPFNELVAATRTDKIAAEKLKSVVQTREMDAIDAYLRSELMTKPWPETENNSQTSRNPLNGRQQKEHKKRRKGGSGKK